MKRSKGCKGEDVKRWKGSTTRGPGQPCFFDVLDMGSLGQLWCKISKVPWMQLISSRRVKFGCMGRERSSRKISRVPWFCLLTLHPQDTPQISNLRRYPEYPKTKTGYILVCAPTVCSSDFLLSVFEAICQHLLRSADNQLRTMMVNDTTDTLLLSI